MRATKILGSLNVLLASLWLAPMAMAGPPADGIFVGFDFNGDGKGDIARTNASVVTNLLDGVTTIGTGSYSLGGGAFELMAIGNHNVDDNADPIFQGKPATAGAGSVRVSLTNVAGTGQASAIFIPDGGTSWIVVDAADVNDDGVDEVIFEGAPATPAAGAVRIANIASGTPVYSFLSTAGGIWRFAFSADVNGDGSEDLVFNGQPSTSAAGTTRANLAGTTTAKFYATGGGAWLPISGIDSNNDDVDDLLQMGQPSTPAAGFDRVVLLNTSGDPAGGVAYIGNAGNTLEARVVGDFNGDSNQDVGYQGATTNRLTLLNGIAILGSQFAGNQGGGSQLRLSQDTGGTGTDVFDLISVVTSNNNVFIQTLTGTGVGTVGTINAAGTELFF